MVVVSHCQKLPLRLRKHDMLQQKEVVILALALILEASASIVAAACLQSQASCTDMQLRTRSHRVRRGRNPLICVCMNPCNMCRGFPDAACGRLPLAAILF
eukprot:3049785-Amphidinium_carterae.1